MNNILKVVDKSNLIDDINIDQCFSRISQLVKENLSLDKDWDQFKLHFEEVNPGFFYNLKENYPELSQNDLKLCAYYRINLNSKEISRILNVSPAAVQKSRYRLRKKMNIPSEMELHGFVSQF